MELMQLSVCSEGKCSSEIKSSINPRESYHWLRNQGVLDGVESLEGPWVERCILIHAFSGKVMQGLGDERNFFDVVAEEIAQPN